MADQGTPPSIPAVLDHVAVAAETWHQAWPRYVGELGGSWSSGERGPGFAPCQLAFANGARLEILAPHRPELNPFLRRFIDRSGAGPHHLTFKVPDLDAAIDACRDRGIEPVNVDRSDPGWQEAFIHPARALGIVVQLAQQRGDWQLPAPDDFPEPARPAASLVRATHSVADLAAGEALFAGLLGGAVAARSTSADGRTLAVDLAWRGPLGLRLVGPAPRAEAPHTQPPGSEAPGSEAPGSEAPGSEAALRSWLGGRSGRLHHVAFACAAPDRVTGAVALHPVGAPLAAGDGTALVGVPACDPVDRLGLRDGDGAVAVVPPEANLGTRLVLCRTNP